MTAYGPSHWTHITPDNVQNVTTDARCWYNNLQQGLALADDTWLLKARAHNQRMVLDGMPVPGDTDQPRSVVIEACQHLHLEVLRYILLPGCLWKNGFPGKLALEVDNFQRTPLHLAVRADRPDIIDLLLACEQIHQSRQYSRLCLLLATSSNGINPVALAMKLDRCHCMHAVIVCTNRASNGVCPTRSYNLFRRNLVKTAKTGQENMARAMCAADDKLMVTVYTQIPLMFTRAARDNNLAYVHMLSQHTQHLPEFTISGLGKHPMPHFIGRRQCTEGLLTVAVRSLRTKVVIWLFTMMTTDADTDTTRDEIHNALQVAAKVGNHRVLRLLLPTATLSEVHAYHLMHVAVWYTQMTVITVLLEYFPLLCTLWCDDSQRTLMEAAIQTGCLSVYQSMQRRGCPGVHCRRTHVYRQFDIVLQAAIGLAYKNFSVETCATGMQACRQFADLLCLLLWDQHEDYPGLPGVLLCEVPECDVQPAVYQVICYRHHVTPNATPLTGRNRELAEADRLAIVDRSTSIAAILRELLPAMSGLSRGLIGHYATDGCLVSIRGRL
jgi:hypothetical protein